MDFANVDLNYIGDDYSRLILKSTILPKPAIEISKETDIPLGTVYRRLEILKNCGFLKISGKIENGVKMKLYHNKRLKYHVSNPRIFYLLDIIYKNPGLSYRDIQKISGFPFGTLSNSLKNLEKDSKIIVKRSKRRTNYFSQNIPIEEHIVLINFRKETCNRILKCLIENKKCTFSEIREFVQKSPSTVSHSLTNLIERNIIRRIRGIPPYFEFEDSKIVFTALTRIEPNTVDKMTDRFADTFSYF